MKALIISDTHGNVTSAFAAYSRSQPVDVIVHLGDGSADVDLLREALDVTVIAVAGNCDSGSAAPRERVWEFEGKRILLTHGDLYQVKYGLALVRERAMAIGADAVLFGHTHQEVSIVESGLLLVNPGSLSSYGSHRCFAVMTIADEEITVQHHVIE